jgi:hypothetical protein
MQAGPFIFAPEKSICHPLDGHEAALGSDRSVDDILLAGHRQCGGHDLCVRRGGADRLYLHTWPRGIELSMFVT